jgi:hypothetical protein
MSAPIPDQPPPAQQQSTTDQSAFQAGPPAAQLCGFTVPTFRFSPSFKLPPISFPPKLPSFLPSLGISCASTNPLAVPDLPYGGGRVATYDADPDAVYDQDGTAGSDDSATTT